MRRDLPAGTVTFLFTDIEGSTRLLHALGPDAYAEALAEHRRVLREAFAAHGGVEVDTQGDAFFVAFPTADGRRRRPRARAGRGARAWTDHRAHGPAHGSTDRHRGGLRRRRRAPRRAGRRARPRRPDRPLARDGGAARRTSRCATSGAHRLKDFDGAIRLYQLGLDPVPAASHPRRASSCPLPRPASSGASASSSRPSRSCTNDEPRVLTDPRSRRYGQDPLRTRARAGCSPRRRTAARCSARSRRCATRRSCCPTIGERLGAAVGRRHRRSPLASATSERTCSSTTSSTSCPTPRGRSLSSRSRARSCGSFVTSREPLADPGRGRARPAAARRTTRRVTLFLERARAVRPDLEADRRGRRALRTPRQASARARARRGAHEAPLARGAARAPGGTPRPAQGHA